MTVVPPIVHPSLGLIALIQGAAANGAMFFFVCVWNEKFEINFIESTRIKRNKERNALGSS